MTSDSKKTLNLFVTKVPCFERTNEGTTVCIYEIKKVSFVRNNDDPSERINDEQ